jgi:hypothetical protein
MITREVGELTGARRPGVRACKMSVDGPAAALQREIFYAWKSEYD